MESANQVGGRATVIGGTDTGRPRAVVFGAGFRVWGLNGLAGHVKIIVCSIFIDAYLTVAYRL